MSRRQGEVQQKYAALRVVPDDGDPPSTKHTTSRENASCEQSMWVADHRSMVVTHKIRGYISPVGKWHLGLRGGHVPNTRIRVPPFDNMHAVSTLPTNYDNSRAE